MIFADILMWFLLILGAYIVLNSYWLAAYALFPRFSERCQTSIGTLGWRLFPVGLVIFVPWFVAGVAGIRATQGGLKFAGAVLLLLLLLACLMGSTGLAARAGQGLGVQGRSGLQVLRGGSVLGLTFVLPLLGWALMLLTFILGAGAAAASVYGATKE